ncbi:hypothetical protein BD779DRAFT_1471416 [Infundibulicybe gibba]|nr:hypothetical protein BD779DRAFT_1471416 [Infundibulicybe gibba]
MTALHQFITRLPPSRHQPTPRPHSTHLLCRFPAPNPGRNRFYSYVSSPAPAKHQPSPYPLGGSAGIIYYKVPRRACTSMGSRARKARSEGLAMLVLAYCGSKLPLLDANNPDHNDETNDV